MPHALCGFHNRDAILVPLNICELLKFDYGLFDIPVPHTISRYIVITFMCTRCTYQLIVFAIFTLGRRRRRGKFKSKQWKHRHEMHFEWWMIVQWYSTHRGHCWPIRSQNGPFHMCVRATDRIKSQTNHSHSPHIFNGAFVSNDNNRRLAEKREGGRVKWKKKNRNGERMGKKRKINE